MPPRLVLQYVILVSFEPMVVLLEAFWLLRSGDGDSAYELAMRHLGHASRLWSTGSEEERTGEPLIDLFPAADVVTP